MLVVLTRQAVEAQRAADVLFDPVGELWVFALPAGKPRCQIALGFGETADIYGEAICPTCLTRCRRGRDNRAVIVA